jgi:transketolase
VKPPAGTIDDVRINTIRTHSIDAVDKAASGHPGLPMGAAAMAYVLWTRHLRYDPADPEWINRDRFVLSAPGPVVMTQYGFTVEHVVATTRAVLATSRPAGQGPGR